MKAACFEDIAFEARRMAKKTTVAVVEAHDRHTIEAVVSASGDGIMTPLLIGDQKEIKKLLSDAGRDATSYDIAPSCGADESIRLAAEAVNTGKAAALMKGGIESNRFMRGILNKEHRLVTGRRLSLTGFFETPSYHKMFTVSDMVVNIQPDLACKRAIIENAVRLLNKLGCAAPKVAVLASVEKTNPKMQDTVDADALKKLYLSGEIQNCIIEGPISFDLATSAEAARIKGFDSPVAGDADLLIVPDITSGNILVKCLTGMAGARTGALVLGARVPIMLTSRSAEASDKYNSIALAVCAAQTDEGLT